MQIAAIYSDCESCFYVNNGIDFIVVALTSLSTSARTLRLELHWHCGTIWSRRGTWWTWTPSARTLSRSNNIIIIVVDRLTSSLPIKSNKFHLAEHRLSVSNYDSIWYFKIFHSSNPFFGIAKSEENVQPFRNRLNIAVECRNINIESSKAIEEKSNPFLSPLSMMATFPCWV